MLARPQKANLHGTFEKGRVSTTLQFLGFYSLKTWQPKNFMRSEDTPTSSPLGKALPLGKTVAYPKHYDPSLLYKISRSPRTESLINFGFDRWVSYEFTWLAKSGCPKCCALEIIVPSSSKFIVESKSLKLYLGSFAQEKFKDEQEILKIITADLCELLECRELTVNFLDLENCPALKINSISGILIDDDQTECLQFDSAANELLKTSNESCQETLYSNLFRSLCPVTQQPDYATVIVSYKGNKIKPESLTRYLVSFRNHMGFHETCCEKIFEDILSACQPQNLTVACLFNRRGGIEINPVRSNTAIDHSISSIRCARQ